MTRYDQWRTAIGLLLREINNEKLSKKTQTHISSLIHFLSLPASAPPELPEGWDMALGKAASFLRHRATNDNLPLIVNDEYLSVASILTDLSCALNATYGHGAEEETK